MSRWSQMMYCASIRKCMNLRNNMQVTIWRHSLQLQIKNILGRAERGWLHNEYFWARRLFPWRVEYGRICVIDDSHKKLGFTSKAWNCLKCFISFFFEENSSTRNWLRFPCLQDAPLVSGHLGISSGWSIDFFQFQGIDFFGSSSGRSPIGKLDDALTSFFSIWFQRTYLEL